MLDAAARIEIKKIATPMITARRVIGILGWSTQPSGKEAGEAVGKLFSVTIDEFILASLCYAR